jgi:hypothetical protein
MKKAKVLGFAVYVLLHYLGIFLSAVSGFILAQQMTLNDRGTWVFYSTWLSVGSVLTSLNFSNASFQTKWTRENYRFERRGLILKILVYFTPLAVLLSFASFAFIFQTSPTSSKGILILALLSNSFNFITALIEGYFRRSFDGTYSLMRLMGLGLLPIVIILDSLFGKITIFQLLCATIVTNVMLTATFVIFFIKSPRAEIFILRSLISTAIKSLPYYCTSSLMTFSVIVLLSFKYSHSELAVIGIGLSWAMLVNVPLTGFINSFASKILLKGCLRKRDFLMKMAIFLTLDFTFAVFSKYSFLFLPHIIGAKYHTLSTLGQAFATYNFFLQFSLFTTASLLALKENRLLFYSNLLWFCVVGFLFGSIHTLNLTLWEIPFVVATFVMIVVQLTIFFWRPVQMIHSNADIFVFDFRV